MERLRKLLHAKEQDCDTSTEIRDDSAEERQRIRESLRRINEEMAVLSRPSRSDD
jgi:hypothetical protein